MSIAGCPYPNTPGLICILTRRLGDSPALGHPSTVICCLSSLQLRRLRRNTGCPWANKSAKPRSVFVEAFCDPKRGQAKMPNWFIWSVVLTGLILAALAMLVLKLVRDIERQGGWR